MKYLLTLIICTTLCSFGSAQNPFAADAPNVPSASSQADHVLKIARETFERNLIAYNRGMTIIWDNPHGYTPQEVFDALGTQAGMTVSAASMVRQQLEYLRPGSTAHSVSLMEGYTLSINDDGTVTVSALE